MSPKKQHLALLKHETDMIRIHYSEFTQSFQKSFLNREQRNEANFNDLRFMAQNLFDFEDEYIESFESNTKRLLLEILQLQSYLDFGLLKTIIGACGTPEDIEKAEIYTEAFRQYAKRRIFECDVEILDKSLPENDTVIFVLDKSQSIGANDLKMNLAKLLGIKQQKIILHKMGEDTIKNMKVGKAKFH